MKIPILSDLTKQVSRDYGVLLEDAGISLRYNILLKMKIYYFGVVFSAIKTSQISSNTFYFSQKALSVLK